MNNKLKPILLLAVLCLLLGGTYVLYQQLSKQEAPDNLQINKPTATPSEDKVSPENNQSNEENVTPPENSDENTEENATDSNFQAPDFTVYDREGNQVKLSDFFGKPIVLNFWASWCGPCKMEMPDFEEAYKQYGTEIHFLMVNLTDGAQESMKTATAFLDNSGYTFPVYYDKDTDAAMTYQVYSIPTTYFISAQGELIAQGSGALDAETIQRGIEMILE